MRRPVAWLAQTSGRLVGWLSWVFIALVWLSVVALLRTEGRGGTALDVIQLVPTIGLLFAFALLLELATSHFSPAAGDNGSGVAAAIALALALDAAPPHHMSVDLVLQGAGDGEGIGLREYLRSRKHVRQSANTVALGFAACGAGRPSWWISDGALVPRRYSMQLRAICTALAREDGGYRRSPIGAVATRRPCERAGRVCPRLRSAAWTTRESHPIRIKRVTHPRRSRLKRSIKPWNSDCKWSIV